MKMFKAIGLTFFFTIGLVMPSCYEDTCEGVVFEVYFDVFGIDISSYTDYEIQGGGAKILSNDTISFDEIMLVHF